MQCEQSEGGRATNLYHHDFSHPIGQRMHGVKLLHIQAMARRNQNRNIWCGQTYKSLLRAPTNVL